MKGNDLLRKDVERILNNLCKSVPIQECWTCDCLQGFLVQIASDAEENVSDLIDPFKVDHERMHGCLGCDPCPPAEAFSEYIRKGQERAQ